MSNRNRLIALDLLPLTYDRELKDSPFFYKSLFNHIHLDVQSFTNFISHGRTRLRNSSDIKTPIYKTSTFQASYFNCIVKLYLLLLLLVLRVRSPSSFSLNKHSLIV